MHHACSLMTGIAFQEEEVMVCLWRPRPMHTVRLGRRAPKMFATAYVQDPAWRGGRGGGGGGGGGSGGGAGRGLVGAAGRGRGERCGWVLPPGTNLVTSGSCAVLQRDSDSLHLVNRSTQLHPTQCSLLRTFYLLTHTDSDSDSPRDQ